MFQHNYILRRLYLFHNWCAGISTKCRACYFNHNCNTFYLLSIYIIQRYIIIILWSIFYFVFCIEYRISSMLQKIKGWKSYAFMLIFNNVLKYCCLHRCAFSILKPFCSFLCSWNNEICRFNESFCCHIYAPNVFPGLDF